MPQPDERFPMIDHVDLSATARSGSAPERTYVLGADEPTEFVVTVAAHEDVPSEPGAVRLVLRNPDGALARMDLPLGVPAPAVGESITITFDDEEPTDDR